MCLPQENIKIISEGRQSKLYQIRRSGSSIATNQSQFPVKILSSIRRVIFTLLVSNCIVRVSIAVKWIIPVRVSDTRLRNTFWHKKKLKKNLIWKEKRENSFPCKIRRCLFEITKVINSPTNVVK